MADTRTIWIQACIDAIKAHWERMTAPGQASGQPEYYRGILAAAEVLEKMLTAEPTEGSGITVDSQVDEEVV